VSLIDLCNEKRLTIAPSPSLPPSLPPSATGLPPSLPLFFSLQNKDFYRILFFIDIEKNIDIELKYYSIKNGWN
jgi:hypothetical protein